MTFIPTLPSSARSRLAALVAGTAMRWPFADEDVLELAQIEGVVALVAARLKVGLPGTPIAVGAVFADAARDESARWLRRQAECRRVLAQLQPSGFPILVLKGMALACWAYDAPHQRACADIDLLFADRASALAAAERLAADGYTLREHFGDAAACEFQCKRGQVEVDMHWGLSGMPLFRQRFEFAELLAAAQAVPLLAPDARGLGPEHAFLHACMHRAADLGNGANDLKWLYDLHAIVRHWQAAQWAAMGALAGQHGLAGVAAVMLRESAALFGTGVPSDVLADLERARRAETLDAERLRDWPYMQRQSLRALPSWPSRIRWLWQRAFPTRHYREDTGALGVGPGLVWHRLQRMWRRLRA